MPAKNSSRLFLSYIYFIFNDHLENSTKNITDKLTAVDHFSEATSMFYKVNKISEKTPLFKTSNANNMPCIIESSFFDNKTGTYAVLVWDFKQANEPFRVAKCKFE